MYSIYIDYKDIYIVYTYRVYIYICVCMYVYMLYIYIMYVSDPIGAIAGNSSPPSRVPLQRCHDGRGRDSHSLWRSGQVQTWRSLGGTKKRQNPFSESLCPAPPMENKSCCFMSFSVSLCPQGRNSILPAFTLICFPFLVGAKQCQWHAPQRAEAKGADGETGTQAGRVHERPEVARKAIPHEKICTSNNKKIHI